MPWFSGLAILLDLVETTGTWLQGLLDAYIAMIPHTVGDSTLWVNGPSVSFQWCTVRLGHLREWVEGWLPKSVFSLATGAFAPSSSDYGSGLAGGC